MCIICIYVCLYVYVYVYIKKCICICIYFAGLKGWLDYQDHERESPNNTKCKDYMLALS